MESIILICIQALIVVKQELRGLKYSKNIFLLDKSISSCYKITMLADMISQARCLHRQDACATF